MFRKVYLKPLTTHETDIEFEWDPETGAVRGRDADRVRDLAAEAKARGEATGDPYPTVYAIEDPLRNDAELAVVLGRYWQLDEALTGKYPTAPGEALPEGAIA